MGGWVGPGASLDLLEMRSLAPAGIQILDHLVQVLATYGTRVKRGTWNDFQWHAEWIEIQ